MTYTFKNATIDNFGTHKTTGKPYIRFVAEDGTTNYAYIHPALSYIPTGETYSPIGAIVHNKTVTTVRTVEKKDSNGKRYFNCDAPYPTDEQIEAIIHSSPQSFDPDIHEVMRAYPLVTLTRMAEIAATYIN